MFIEPKDLHLRLVFSPCLRAMCIFEAAGISTRGGNGNPESGHWHWRVDCCPFGGFCTYSSVVQNWWHSLPERSVPTSCRSDSEAFATTWTRRSIFLEAATGRPDDRTALRDQLWPACKGDLTTWPPDQPRTLLAEHLSHLLLKLEGFWGKPVGFYLIHRKRQVGSERSQTFRTLRLELETWALFKANPSLAK